MSKITLQYDTLFFFTATQKEKKRQWVESVSHTYKNKIYRCKNNEW